MLHFTQPSLHKQLLCHLACHCYLCRDGCVKYSNVVECGLVCALCQPVPFIQPSLQLAEIFLNFLYTTNMTKCITLLCICAQGNNLLLSCELVYLRLRDTGHINTWCCAHKQLKIMLCAAGKELLYGIPFFSYDLGLLGRDFIPIWATK